jgi:hypothetical protein
MGPSGVRANFCLKSKAKLSLKWRVKVGPGPFVSSLGAVKGPDARVVQPGGPALHRAAVSATSIQPTPGVVPLQSSAIMLLQTVMVLFCS